MTESVDQSETKASAPELVKNMKKDLTSVQNTFQDNKNKLAQQIQQLNKFVSEEIAATNESFLEVKENTKKITPIVKAKYGQ